MRSAAAASTTAGAETAKSGRWCSPHAEDVEADPIGELDLLEQVAQALGGRDRATRRRVGRASSANVWMPQLEGFTCIRRQRLAP